ncbi:HD domain-containing protein [Histidinibacterium aquaticum]|uniref:5'-deoxynucleotidase n=1 Tax=Histidinibacterium aquaticum TaxID=2613962 RepID=A0A5J5GPD4_9RHOB|nr:HD domain-containing protein [Histidinibacterium aquaticum]KAA9009302.1 HD domain-containing protein [Histidinibacterium aquaticum]
MTDRLADQIRFLTAADRLKGVTRANVLMDGSRHENTAEHSWHLALWAMVFADLAPGTDPDRTVALCLVHDLVEIYAGDHPAHLEHDPLEVSARESEAADRLFPLLPEDQARRFRELWEEFETASTPEARAARRLDTAQPVLQELSNPTQSAGDRDATRAILTTGRAAVLADDWPELHRHAMALLDRTGALPEPVFAARLRFLAEADRLKSVLRATTIFDGSRPENSAEHSWHLALFALLLAEHGTGAPDPARAARMLVLHDLVEIDAGDTPLHGGHDAAAQAAKEQAAADRIFGLLPPGEGAALRALWEEFEAAETADAVFAKAVDRVQPVLANLETGGGTWTSYKVDRDALERRVGTPVRRGAPALWAGLTPRIDDWFGPATPA